MCQIYYHLLCIVASASKGIPTGNLYTFEIPPLCENSHRCKEAAVFGKEKQYTWAGEFAQNYE